MMRWARGEAIIERLIDGRRLQKVSGAQADGAALLARAHRTVETARMIATDDPDSAYVLAYDAMRQACTALLAHQGLRPTTQGGHYAVEEAVRAQFGDAATSSSIRHIPATRRSPMRPSRRSGWHRGSSNRLSEFSRTSASSEGSPHRNSRARRSFQEGDPMPPPPGVMTVTTSPGASWRLVLGGSSASLRRFRPGWPSAPPRAPAGPWRRRSVSRERLAGAT